MFVYFEEEKKKRLTCIVRRCHGTLFFVLIFLCAVALNRHKIRINYRVKCFEHTILTRMQMYLCVSEMNNDHVCVFSNVRTQRSNARRQDDTDRQIDGRTDMHTHKERYRERWYRRKKEIKWIEFRIDMRMNKRFHRQNESHNKREANRMHNKYLDFIFIVCTRCTYVRNLSTC